MNDIAIGALQERLKRLDSEYTENRKVLLDAIQRLTGRSHSERMATQPAIQSRNGTQPLLREQEAQVGSLSKVVHDYVSHLSGEFTVKEVRDYVAHHHPDIYNHTNPRSIGARLWEYCDNGLLTVVRGGKGGQPNVYIRKGSQH